MTSETDAPVTVATENQTLPGKRKRKWILSAAALIAAVVGWNATVTIPVASALAGEDSHTIVAYRSWLVSPATIVIDVWRVDQQGSMADMDRLLFKAAEALKERRYETVILAYNGRGRFKLEGLHFRIVGRSFAGENPIYLMRTLTSHMTSMDGSPAFGTWTGGWLGVALKQIEDHNRFHEEWWVRPALGLDQ